MKGLLYKLYKSINMRAIKNIKNKKEKRRKIIIKIIKIAKSTRAFLQEATMLTWPNLLFIAWFLEQAQKILNFLVAPPAQTPVTSQMRVLDLKLSTQYKKKRKKKRERKQIW